jgi:hypothetical protein
MGLERGLRLRTYCEFLVRHLSWGVVRRTASLNGLLDSFCA